MGDNNELGIGKVDIALNPRLKSMLEQSRRIQQSLSYNPGVQAWIKESQRFHDQIASNQGMLAMMDESRRMQESVLSSPGIQAWIKESQRFHDQIASNQGMLAMMEESRRMQEKVLSSPSIQAWIKESKKIHVQMNDLNIALTAAQNFGRSLGLRAGIVDALKASQSTVDALKKNYMAVLPYGFKIAINEFESSISQQEEVISRQLSEKDVDVEIKEENTFISDFIIRPYLIFFFMHIVLPIITGLAVVFITPRVNELIQDVHKQDINRKAKKINLNDIDNIILLNLRFISADEVRLRDGPSIKSNTIDVLYHGQIVSFIDKQKNWTNIMIQYESGEIIEGWVFTRYVKKFRN